MKTSPASAPALAAHSQHTPGPYDCPGTDDGAHVICHDDKSGKRRTLAHVYHPRNVPLFVAAPDLLAFAESVAALGKLSYHNTTPEQFTAIIERARAVCAKAKGTP